MRTISLSVRAAAGLPAGRTAARGLLSAAVISFSLTFVGISMALLFGLLPLQVMLPSQQEDIGVILLLVPLCALVFAIVAEVLRASFLDPLGPQPPALAKVGRRSARPAG